MSSDKKIVGIVSYITFIGWIVALIMNSSKKTEFGSFHVRQALLVNLLGFIPIIGFFAAVIFAIMGIISASSHKMDKLPLIGEYAQKWFKAL